MDNQRKGIKGEAITERYLISEGYTIVCRRFRCQWGENDIIAKKDDLLCFVEVKARMGHRYGYGAEAITKNKMISASRAAQRYLQLNPHEGSIRFDVSEVDLQSETVRYLPAAFEALV